MKNYLLITTISDGSACDTPVLSPFLAKDDEEAKDLAIRMWKKALEIGGRFRYGHPWNPELYDLLEDRKIEVKFKY